MPSSPPAGADAAVMNENAPTHPAPGSGLVRQLGVWDAASIYVGIVFGSGIFVAPAAVAAAAPGLGGALLLWLVGGALAACGAFCYAEAATRLPRTGGFYVFYREAFGEPAAQVGGWAALLLTYPAGLAGVALVFAHYLEQLLPSVGLPAGALAAAAIATAGVLNVLGVRTGAWTQRLLTALKVAALLVLCLAALAGAPEPGPSTQSPLAMVPDLGLLLGALVLILWTYDGWSDVTMIAGELREPGRTLGRSVVLGSAVLVMLYVAVQVAVGLLLTPQQAAGSERVFADAAEAGLGPGAGRLVSALIVVSTFGAINGMVITTSRLAWALAKDRAVPSWFARIDPRRHTPYRAIAGLVAVSGLYLFVGDFRDIVGWFSFAVWIFYAFGAIALLVLRRRAVGSPPAWRAPGGWLLPGIVIAASAAMVAGQMAEAPQRSLTALALLLAGFPIHALWRRLRA